MVRSLLMALSYLLCLQDEMLEANLGGSGGLLVNPILLFSLPLSGRSPESDITEILLTGTLNLKYQETLIPLSYLALLEKKSADTYWPGYTCPLWALCQVKTSFIEPPWCTFFLLFIVTSASEVQKFAKVII